MLRSVLAAHRYYLPLETAVSLETMASLVLTSSTSSPLDAPSESENRSKACVLLILISVTSVGATGGISPETAADFSGGGFSNYFPRPSYQDGAIETFLTGLGTTYSGLYNASGRAYPDVAAQGVNFEIAWYGYVWLGSGTSCSTPTFASIISLINDQLISAGKPVLGFLNPWLYSTAAPTFTDITSGNAAGCNVDGFSAVEGWDPVRG